MRVGIIGCGKIAAKAHLPALAINGLEIAAVCDLDETKAKAFSKRFKIRHYFIDYTEMLRNVDIDFVDICTPTRTHATIAIDAAKLGKHVLVEKPISYSLDDALRMIDAARDNRVKLCVVQNFRYFPAMQHMKQAIEQGRLGNIVSIEGTCHQHFPLKWSPKSWWFEEGGIIYDVGIHMLDLVIWLFKESPIKVYAIGGDFLTDMNCINHAHVIMDFKKGRAALCDFSWLTGRTVFSLDVHGTGGHAFSDLCFNHYHEVHGLPTPLDDIRSFVSKMSTFTRDLISGKFFLGSLAYHKILIREFISSIKNNAEVPVTGKEALYSLAVAQAIKQSIKENRVIRLSDIFSEKD